MPSTSDSKSNNSSARILFTLVLILLWAAIGFLFHHGSTVAAGDLSVQQFQDSNTSYMISKTASFFTGQGLPSIILLAFLALIWWKPVSRLFVLATVGLLLGNVPCQAYYNERNDVEFKELQPNQTAFLIPEQGANKSAQGAFDSAAYLDSNKVATKRIEIPHTLLPKTGWMTKDVYIPAAKLVIVTREPFTRCWTKDSKRGTSAKDEGFYFETKESINVDCGVSISAFIALKDAATFLYNFGVGPQTDPSDREHPEFASIVYAKSLEEVMDSIVMQDVQRLIAREYGKRTLEEGISQKAEVMEAVESEIIKTYAEMGITIKYVGYATPLNFDVAIQQAINDKFIAKKNAEAAADRMTSMPVLTALADIKIKEGIATAASKWDGHISLPSFLLVSDQLANTLGSWFKTPPAPAAPEPAVKKSSSQN